MKALLNQPNMLIIIAESPTIRPRLLLHPANAGQGVDGFQGGDSPRSMPPSVTSRISSARGIFRRIFNSDGPSVGRKSLILLDRAGGFVKM
jgi:hypothetical protein